MRREDFMNDRKEYKKKKNNKNRILAIFAICIIIMGVFVVRLLQLQVFGGKEYRAGAISQRQREVEILPERGTIRDRNGNPLALSVKVNTCYLFPKEITEKEKTAQQLAEALSLETSFVMSKINSGNEILKLKSRLSAEESKILQEGNIEGVSVSVENGRYYPSNSLAAHVIGFTDSENNGTYGIEETFNDILKGIPGKKSFSKSLSGGVIPYEEYEVVKPINGNNLTLTIDDRIQTIISTHAKKLVDEYAPKNVSIIVMNPNNGDILGLENYPNYNLNEPRKPGNLAEKEAWDRLSEEKLLEEYYARWRSYSVNDVYEPGSIFKLITTAAALEEGTANTTKSTYTCKGTITDIPGVVIRCYRWYDPHGEQTLEEALANSCNPAFVQIARDLGKDKFYSYIKAFGFGEKTGIDLPAEALGIIPKTSEAITATSLATLSYGHGIAATPLQMATAVCAIVNGGNLYEPRLVLQVANDQNEVVETRDVLLRRKVISEETSKTLREFMENNVENGTATNGRIEGFHVGGKTGTSIKFINGAYTSEKTTASFIGTYPIENPQYVVLAVVDEPERETGGNVVAGSLVRDIIKDIITLDGDVPKKNGDTGKDVVVPSVKGLSLEEAAKILDEKNLQHSINNYEVTERSIVIDQYPEANVKVLENSIVDLKSDAKEIPWIKMPDLKGLSLEEAEHTLKEIGLRYEYSGEGTVKGQEPGKDILVDPESIIKFTLGDQ